MTAPPIGLTAPETVTLTRYAAQTIGSDGRPDRGSPTSTSIAATVAPASPRTLERLPEGMRTRSVLTVHAYDQIRTADQHTGTPGDEIVRGGITYAVEVVDEWPALGPIPQHWQAIVVRLAELPAVGGP